METVLRRIKISCRRPRSLYERAYLKGGQRTQRPLPLPGANCPEAAWTGIHPVACGWSRHPDLNRGPTVYETVALPTELCRPGRRALLLTTPRWDGQAAFPQRWAARH